MEVIRSVLFDDEDEDIDYEDEDDTDSESSDDKVPVKKTRKRYPRKDATKSGWWKDLQRQYRDDCPQYFRKRWLSRFRVPIETFDHIVDLFKRKGWYDEKQGRAGSGVPPHPFELKLMGALRYLGRGEVFDTIAECCDDTISSETFRTFTRWFCFKMYSIKDEYIRLPDPKNMEEMSACMKPYSDAGLNGAIGSIDGVAVAWGNAPASRRHEMIGKVPYPHVGFNCVVNHARRFLHVSQVFPGGINDLTKVHYDSFCQDLLNGKYDDVKVHLYNDTGSVIEYRGACYVISDGGYHE